MKHSTRRTLLLLTACLLLTPDRAVAQDHEHVSPYAGDEARDIKALSAEEIEGLLEGRGMTLALPAELNGLPGPKHVLEMKSELNLTSDQERMVQTVFDAMIATAREQGAHIVELERRLDREFADRTITEDTLDEILAALAVHRASLRASHLKAHLKLLPILTDEQRMHYNRLRGYAAHG
ncbi:MAG: Spy/CpxP family protein refolding chaperone [Gemmatimonadota bacterium]|nr:Spy/CpxP family protein refolding chaperone [Gemmatimonadota bacterium]